MLSFLLWLEKMGKRFSESAYGNRRKTQNVFGEKDSKRYNPNSSSKTQRKSVFTTKDLNIKGAKRLEVFVKKARAIGIDKISDGDLIKMGIDPKNRDSLKKLIQNK
jgi:hypothetical protein